MADYSSTVWLPRSDPASFPVSASLLNKMEAGVKDAAQFSKQRGPLNTRPPAAPSNKNWIWIDSATGAASFSDGTAWYDFGGGGGGSGGAVFMEDWAVPALQNAWVEVGDTSPQVGYRRSPIGEVSLRGAVKSGVVGQPIFTLPVGYRPTALTIVPVLNWNGTNTVIGTARITSAGAVSLDAPGSNGGVYLNNVSFFVDAQQGFAFGGAPFENWREVGAAGQPAFVNSWANANAASDATLAFAKNAQGLVTVKGRIGGGNLATAVFTLPDGYRPAQQRRFAATIGHNNVRYPAIAYVTSTGVVQAFSEGTGAPSPSQEVTLEFTFLADGPGGRGGASGRPVLTALPTTGLVDGMEILFKTSTGDRWELQYDTSISDAYKWRVLAGVPIVRRLTPSQACTPTAVSIAGSAIAPLPVAGVYDAEVSASIQSGAGVGGVGVVTMYVAGGGNSGVGAYVALNAGYLRAGNRDRARVTLPIGGVDLAAYSGGAGHDMNVVAAYLELWPIRVG